MPTYTPLYARSPFFVEESGTAGQDVAVYLYAHQDPNLQPVIATHSMSKTIPTGLTKASFDISPYLREYLTFDSFTEVTADTVGNTAEYVRVAVKTYLDAVLQNTYYYIAFDGFGYFEDDYNPTSNTGKMTEGTYYVREGGSCGSVFYYDDQTVTWEAKWTGLTTAGTTTITLANEYGHVPYIHPNYVGEGNKLEIIRNAVTVSTYYFREECEAKYTPVVCDFINKFGAWQQLIFFKRSRTKYDMKNEEYKMFPSDVNYSVTSNISQTFNTNLQESITVNSGFVNEDYQEVMTQLLLSQKILLDSRPVTLTTKSIDMKDTIYDKVMNYEITFNYANHKLNYII